MSASAFLNTFLIVCQLAAYFLKKWFSRIATDVYYFKFVVLSSCVWICFVDNCIWD